MSTSLAPWNGRCGMPRCNGTLLVHGTDAIGRMIWECPTCLRYVAGICQDCPRARVGRSCRCDPCRVDRRRRQLRDRDARHIPKRVKAQREYRRNRYRNDPVYRQRHIDDMSARYHAKPVTESDRAYWRVMKRQSRARRCA